MICAGFRSGGKGLCWGDSGGPMMIKKGSVWVQSGVVSYGGCGVPKFPGVYARVSQYEDWIKNHTGSSKPGFVDYMSQGVDSDLDFDVIHNGGQVSVQEQHYKFFKIPSVSYEKDWFYMSIRNMMVVLGLESMSGPNLNKVSKTIDKIIVHPMYYFFIDNDMALLKLSSPVNFTDYIQPVCLASANSTFYTGVSSWVVGFGANSSGGSNADTLQELRVPVVGNNECTCDHPYYNRSDKMICAGFRSGGKGLCWGDSGGPMMIKKGSVWVQSGVASYAVGCGAEVSWRVDSDLNFVCPTIPTPTQHPSLTTQHPYPTTQDTYPTTHYPYPPTQHPYATTHHPYPPTQYPYATTHHPYTTEDGSVFGSGERVISSLGLLLMSLYALVGGI
ncbi:hypothetical protein JOQ06_020518 [Pogonophryne albipinna]|uniref:Peptidase S1 domain-containing protein n=1 Tax=Pogonophryne albipinna TaxID=1090488 RepID=A0AAD6BQK1_9TELE|nr:hypothetical protein JOQ06_020518 [Pogonophryne albipinna]